LSVTLAIADGILFPNVSGCVKDDYAVVGDEKR
jgi:hypothetical protein